MVTMSMNPSLISTSTVLRGFWTSVHQLFALQLWQVAPVCAGADDPVALHRAS